jgi:hypothetical protein
MYVVTDHWGYWTNDEQSLIRMAAEIDQDRYWHSRFWRGSTEPTEEPSSSTALVEAVRRRRTRVSVIAGFRALAIAVGLLATAVLLGDLLSATGLPGLWANLSLVPRTTQWAYPLANAIQSLWQSLRTALPPLAGPLDGFFNGTPFWLLGAASVILVTGAFYSLVRAFVWDPWDRAERSAAIRDIALAGEKVEGRR